MTSRIGVIALAGIAALLWGSSAIAGNSTSGVEAVRAKNTQSKTIQLGQHTYEVEGNTVIRDERGNEISLADLPVPDLANGASKELISHQLGAFVAEREGQKLLLRSLDLQASAR
jgi:hypothetical protein